MPKAPKELMEYKHKALINELNEFMIKVKIYTIIVNDSDYTQEQKDKLVKNTPPPTLSEIDNIHMKINEILEKDAEPMRKY